jgi:hypothetical protein
LFNDKSPLVRCAAVKAVAGCGKLGQMYASEVGMVGPWMTGYAMVYWWEYKPIYNFGCYNFDQF